MEQGWRDGAWEGDAWSKQQRMDLSPDGLAGEEGQGHEPGKVVAGISRVWVG